MTHEEKRKLLMDPKYPLSAKYDPDLLLENPMGSPCLWLVEALTRKMELKPGMRVLDMGCGAALTSIFLAKEFDVQVFATDLWVDQNDNWKRICEAGVDNLVYPIRAEAHALPYKNDFFDAVVCINSYQFFGTADNYFNQYFGKLVKQDGQIGFALPAIYKEFDDLVPDYLQEHWLSEFYYFHSFDWWKRHFKRSGTVDTETVDDFDGYGNEIMMKWEPIVDKMRMIRVDNGRNLSWMRMVLRKK